MSISCKICGKPACKLVLVNDPTQGNCGQTADVCGACHDRADRNIELQRRVYPTQGESEEARAEYNKRQAFERSRIQWYQDHPGQEPDPDLIFKY